MAGIRDMSTELFRPITKSKKGEYLKAGGSLSYSTLRKEDDRLGVPR